MPEDGAADHLVGAELPRLVPDSSLGRVSLRDLDVIDIYPRTGTPGQPLPAGWDETPGARGRTPQSCHRRLTLVAENARVVKVFYPVFPPDANAGDVLEWLERR